MKPEKRYNWLQVVENCSVISCLVGSIASVVSQQLVYTSVSFAIALSLNLINKSKFQQQIQQHHKTTTSETHQAIQSLHEQVQTLPTQIVDVDPIYKSLLQLQQATRTLSEQFNTRPETQEVEQLKTQISQFTHLLKTLSLRFDNLPTYTEVDTSEIERTVAHLSHHLDNLSKQVNAKLDQQAIEELKVALNQIKNETETQVKALKEQLPTFDFNQISSDIANLQNKIHEINQQYLKTPSFDLNYLEERLSEIEKKNLNSHKDHISRLLPVIKQLQSDKAITEGEIAKISSQINTLQIRLDNLPTPSPVVDLNEVETSITKLDNQLNSLAQKFLSRSEPAAIQRIAQIVNRLQEHFNSLPLSPDSIDFNELKKVIAGVHERLSLLESLNITAINEQLTQFQTELKSAFQQIEHQRLFQSSVVELSSAQVEGLKQEVEKLKFQIIRNLSAKIEQLQQQASPKLNHLENIETHVTDLQNENQKLRQDVDKYNSELNKVTVLLEKQNQNMLQIQQKLETVQNLVNGLDEKTDSSQNLDQIQQQLNHLQQLMTEYVKTEYFDNILLDLCEEFSKQIDTVVDMRVSEIHQLIERTSSHGQANKIE
jgi:DNA repair exonuclease SbcCD ATPase subunit